MPINLKKYLLLALSFLLAIWFYQNHLERSAPLLQVNFLDIGQGDATLISDNQHHQILIDGGPNGRNLLYQLGKVMPPLDKKIELVILTHPDGDHYLGLIDLLENYQVEKIITNSEKSNEESFGEFEEKIKNQKIPTGFLFENDKLNWGNAQLTILSPSAQAKLLENKNENSLVVRLAFGKNTFLLTGDAEAITENRLVRKNKNLRADWLKVGHHGSKNATKNFFLNQVHPKNAVISAGKDNDYGHPHPAVLNRLKNHQVKIWRTD